MKPYRHTCQLYHISESNLNGKTLRPRIPENRMSGEDSRHVRVCFSTNITGCIRAINPDVLRYDDIFYVMVPFDYSKLSVYKPSEKEVPDVKETREKWVRSKVKLKCIGRIKVYRDNNHFTFADWDSFRFRWLEKYC